MDAKCLTPEHCEQPRRQVEPRRDYLARLVARMDALGFPEADPLRVAAVDARDAVAVLLEALAAAKPPAPVPGTLRTRRAGAIRSGAECVGALGGEAEGEAAAVDACEGLRTRAASGGALPPLLWGASRSTRRASNRSIGPPQTQVYPVHDVRLNSAPAPSDSATMRPQINSPELVSKSGRRQKRIFAAAFYGVIILASLGLAVLVVAAAVIGQDGSPGEVAAVAGVGMLPGCVAGLALTARR